MPAKKKTVKTTKKVKKPIVKNYSRLTGKALKPETTSAAAARLAQYRWGVSKTDYNARLRAENARIVAKKRAQEQRVQRRLDAQKVKQNKAKGDALKGYEIKRKKKT